MEAEPDIVIQLANGGQLVCHAGEEHLYGSALTVTYPDSREPLHWTSQEWADDPEQVIGAVFAAAAKGPATHVMVPRQLLETLREHFMVQHAICGVLNRYLGSAG